MFELLPPANEVCEGYVFTGVCLFTGEGGFGLCPGEASVQGVSVQGGLCPIGVSVCGVSVQGVSVQ